MTSPKKSFRCGYASIVGRPNVGKSTLLNALLEQKLSAVTKKPQTTRHRILGILNGEGYQIIFVDTPGIFPPHYTLQKVMVKSAYNAIKDADILIFLVEPHPPTDEEQKIIAYIKKVGKPTLLAINKIDLVKKPTLLPIIDEYKKFYEFCTIIPISALKKDGLHILLEELIKVLPKHPPFFPQDTLTDRPERFFVQEIIREKIFTNYGEEIPYAATVMVEEFREREDKKDYIRAVIYIEKSSQKGIIIGKGGQALKRVGRLARKEIEEFLGRGVYLELYVKERPGWRDSMHSVKELGYLP